MPGPMSGPTERSLTLTPEISPLKARFIWLDDCNLYLKAILNAIKRCLSLQPKETLVTLK